MASITAPSHAKSLTVSDGYKYGYIRIEAQSGRPTLLFLHGYPSSSYHWHHQIQQCIDSGFGMVAPDLLGYGDTDKPSEFEKYDLTVISKHVMEILDHEQLSIVIGVGHDWGSIMLATTARQHTKRFSQLIFLAVGYSPSEAPLQDIDAINAAVAPVVGWPIFGYWKFHNRPDAASLIEAADPASPTSLFYPADPTMWIENMCKEGGMEAWIKANKTTELAAWISSSEIETHNKILKDGGFTGPLNWYKQGMAGVTHTAEAKINPDYAATRFTIPTLLIACENDMICRPVIQEHGMKNFFNDLTVKALKTSHWVMLEQPKEMWEIMHAWIEEKSAKA